MSSTPYDPGLPFLAELEGRVHDFAKAHLETATQTARSPIPRTPAPRRARRSSPARLVRRTAILVALLCLLGASAFGAGAVLFTGALNPPAPHQSRSVTIANGFSGSTHWSLRVYTRAGQVCSELIILSQQEVSRCAPRPADAALESTGLAGITHSYLFGLVGSRVRNVDVAAGRDSATVATRALGKRSHLDIPASTRWFIAVVPRSPGPVIHSATLTARDADLHLLGRRHTCLGEDGPPGCSD